MKQKKKRSSKNLKISTRIMLSAILGILIPIIIITSFSTVLINTVNSNFKLSSVTTNTYSTVNQIQWSQSLYGITNILKEHENDDERLKKLDEFLAPLEKLKTLIYIEKNGENFYSTNGVQAILDKAGELVKIDKNKNLNYFGDDGLVIVNRAKTGSDDYLVVIVNEDYSVKDTESRVTANDITRLIFGKTGIIALAIVLVFVIAMMIISVIASSTIVNPIKKIAHGADEIARGNLNYQIDYKSTNELGQTVDSFNEMRLRLKNSIEKQNKAIEEKNELIAGIAHDLRTPLTSAKGYAEGLLDGIADTPEKQERYIKTICSSINNTEKILDDLLAISRLQLKGYRLNKVDVSVKDFFDDGAQEIALWLEHEGFDFSFNCSCSENTIVSLDTDAFARVVRNIISNSIKYRREDVKGNVIISLNEYDKSVILEIKDNGIGVDKKSLVKIFDAMYRADPARSKQGSGLGLSVCKQIVELHSGLIWASSDGVSGLSIFISLPKKEVLE